MAACNAASMPSEAPVTPTIQIPGSIYTVLFAAAQRRQLPYASAHKICRASTGHSS